MSAKKDNTAADKRFIVKETTAAEEIEEEVAYGEEIDWHKIGSPKSYYPTRLEYFAGKALQGLVTGRADKDLLKGYFLAEKAVKLARELEEVIDTEKD